MNALTIDLVPKGKIRFEQSETGIEMLFLEEQKGKKVKSLGSIKGESLLFLNTFFSSCITIAMEKSRPPEPNYQEIFSQLLKMMEVMKKGEDKDLPPPPPTQEVD